MRIVHALASSQQGVLQEANDGHWTYAPRNRSNKTAFACNVVEIYVTGQFETRFQFWRRNSCHTYINHYSSLLHHIGGNKIGFANRCYNDIRLYANLFQIFRTAVRERHRAIAGARISRQ